LISGTAILTKINKDLSAIRRIQATHSRIVEESLRLHKGMTGTYITELNYTQPSEVGQTVMCGILVHNEGDIPMGSERNQSHLSLVFLRYKSKGGRTQQDRSLAIVIDCSTEASGCILTRSDCFSQRNRQFPVLRDVEPGERVSRAEILFERQARYDL
jgi:hypothetical protein